MNRATISADIVSSTELTPYALSQLQREVKTFVKHLGNEYKSLAEMLRTYKISKSQYDYRQKMGWDLRRILTTSSKDFRVYDHNGVEYLSTKAMCKHYDIPYDTFMKRISKYNMPLEKALTKQVKSREILAG